MELPLQSANPNSSQNLQENDVKKMKVAANVQLAS